MTQAGHTVSRACEEVDISQEYFSNQDTRLTFPKTFWIDTTSELARICFLKPHGLELASFSHGLHT